MKTKFTMIMAVIATFAISLNLHSSNEEVVFGAPAVQMPRGGPKYCAFEAEWENCKMAEEPAHGFSGVQGIRKQRGCAVCLFCARRHRLGGRNGGGKPCGR